MDRVHGFSLIVGLFLLGGCSSSGSEALLPAPTSTPVAVLSYKDIKRPLMSYLPTQQEADQIWRIKGKLLAECYSASGLKKTAVFEGAIPDPSYEENAMSLIWGPVLEISIAKKLGYSDNSGTVMMSFIPEGIISSGILNECNSKIMAVVPRGDGNYLLGGGPRKASDDVRTKEIIEEWSSCMKNRGFNFSLPNEPIAKYKRKAEPIPEEIPVAVADMECKQKTNLVARMLAWQLVYDEDYINKNRAALEKRKQDVKDFIAKHG
ncbi:MAG: hypothetical protein ACRDAX_06380 [Propionibacteriaceae bacterium]